MVETDGAVAVSAAGMAARHAAHAQASRARAAMADPAGARPGVNQLSELGQQRWDAHCAAGWGVPPEIFSDDAACAAWMDEAGAAEPSYDYDAAADDAAADDAMEA
jgi:hypothetical protein